MLTRNMLKLLSANFFLALLSMEASCFNVDTKRPIILDGPPRSYFGYSVVLDEHQRMYVGAPRANNTNRKDVFEPGSLFSCATDRPSCEEMVISSLRDPKTFRIKDKLILRYRIWLGGTLEVGKNGSILACSHRYYNPRYESACGACIVIDTSSGFIVKEAIIPLDVRDSLYTYDQVNREYRSYFANGQLGMSAVFREDGRVIFVGAPGVYEGTGTDYIHYINPPTSKVRAPLIIEPHSYFGYSMTRGKFYNNKGELSAIGAPRDENFGKVYITDDYNNGGVEFVGEILKGFELGEYFGSSVLAVDVNGDSLSDLLVGAPLYSVDTGCDEGRVYVFLSDGKEMKFFTELVGDEKADSRFGTALAKIGDLNRDGFEDIAVGAPYEDGKGAVYIYLGSETGTKREYSQKIEASKIKNDLAGFGIHISRGEDVDKNKYPDIAVGSYLSSNVVLLRSLPVVEVSLDFYPVPPDIRMNKDECLYGSKKLSCVYIYYCLNFSGMEEQPVSLNFHCLVAGEDPNPRGFFLPYRYKNAAIQTNLTVLSYTTNCFTEEFYLHSDIKDVVTPVIISISCELAPLDLNTENDISDKSYFSYPVVSPFSVLNRTRSLPFHSGCENDKVCYSDLVLIAELEDMVNVSVITLGDVTSVTLAVMVRNDGEPAFLSQLLIHLPPEVSVISKDICEDGSEKGKGIKCEIGNPLAKDEMVSFQIKLDLTKISYQTREIEITLECTTNSTEVTQEDNVATLTLGVQTVSDIGIRGIASHSLILYHETEELSSIIKHKYTVRNHGPSPLYSINVILQVPNAISSSQGRREFLFFTGLQTDRQSEMTVPFACNSSHLDTEWFLHAVTLPAEEVDDNSTFAYENNSLSNFINKRDTSGYHVESLDFQPYSRREKASWKYDRETHVLSCDSKDVECVTIQCSASPFTDLRKFSEISVTFRVDFGVLQNHFKSWSQIELISTASLFIPDNDVIILPNHPKISRVKTVFLDVRYSSRDVPQWLYFASFAIGLMLLLQVVFVLIKVGFFKRKEKMALNRLKQSFIEVNIEEELLIDPSENDDVTGEDSGNEKE